MRRLEPGPNGWSRRFEPLLFYVVTRAALIFFLPLHLSDLGHYQHYAGQTLEGGQWPFRHFSMEYPPLAYPLMLLPALLQKLCGLAGTESFRVFFACLLLPMDFSLYRGFRNHSPVRGAAFFYLLLTTAMGQLIFDRFDLALAFLLAWPFLLRKPSEVNFGLSWGLGAALKLVPLFLVPLPAFESWSKPRLVQYSLLAALPLLLSCAVVALVAGGEISFLSYHADRGVQIESLLGSLVLAGKSVLGWWGEVGVVTNFGAQHLGPLAGAVGLSRVLFWGALLGTYAGLWWEKGERDLLGSAWLVLSAFVTFGYVLSPQFLIWLIPLALCAAERVEAGKKRHIWLACLALAVGLTAYHFRDYWSYVDLKPRASLVVLARNLCLLGLWALSWRWMRRPVLSSASS